MCHEQKNFILAIIDYLKSIQDHNHQKDDHGLKINKYVKKILNICNYQKFLIYDFFDNNKIEND